MAYSVSRGGEWVCEREEQDSDDSEMLGLLLRQERMRRVGARESSPPSLSLNDFDLLFRSHL